jgi:hypothetical protein
MYAKGFLVKCAKENFHFCANRSLGSGQKLIKKKVYELTAPLFEAIK